MAQVKGLTQFSGYAGFVGNQTSALAEETKEKALAAKTLVEETKDNALATQYNTLLQAYRTFDEKTLKDQFAMTMHNMSKIGLQFANTQAEWAKYKVEMEDAVKITANTISTLESNKIALVDVPEEGQSEFDADLLLAAFKAVGEFATARSNYTIAVINEYKNNVAEAIAGDWSVTLREALMKMEKANNQLTATSEPIRNLTAVTVQNAEEFKNMLGKMGAGMDMSGSFGQDEVEAARKGVTTIDTSLA